MTAIYRMSWRQSLMRMPSQNETRYELPESVLASLLDYLGTQPYKQVAALIAAIHQHAQRREIAPQEDSNAGK